MSTKKRFRFFLKPDESQDRLLSVPASENEKPPKNCTAVMSDSLRFGRNTIAFVNVTWESEEMRVTAKEMTVRLDKMSGVNISGEKRGWARLFRMTR